MKKFLLACVIVLIFPLAVYAVPYKTVVAFGDSLSDNGNLYRVTRELNRADPSVPVQPNPVLYYQGRFSNGPVWVEYLSDENHLDTGLDDRAYGGARTGDELFPPGLQVQVADYLVKDKPHQNELYTVWAGANDYSAGTAPQTAAVNTAYAVRNLATAGARNVLVMNLPDLGKTPGFRGEQATEWATRYNSSLASDLEGVEGNEPRLNLYEYDVFSIFNEVFSDPEAYGFENVTTPFLATDGTMDPDEYLFWDSIHPTTAGHLLLANQVYEFLEAGIPDHDNGNGRPVSPVPEPATVLLVALGLAGLAGKNRLSGQIPG